MWQDPKNRQLSLDQSLSPMQQPLLLSVKVQQKHYIFLDLLSSSNLYCTTNLLFIQLVELIKRPKGTKPSRSSRSSKSSRSSDSNDGGNDASVVEPLTKEQAQELAGDKVFAFDLICSVSRQ